MLGCACSQMRMEPRRSGIYSFLLCPPLFQAYGRELDEAYDWCLKYKQSRKEAELHQAWDLYYHVFKRINKQLPSLTTLELQYVAPALVRAKVRSWGFINGQRSVCRSSSRLWACFVPVDWRPD